jgi:hypothetical protein
VFPANSEVGTEVPASNLVQDGIGAIILHVVGDNRGKRAPLPANSEVGTEVPDPNTLLLDADKVALKRRVFALKRSSLPPIVTHNMLAIGGETLVSWMYSGKDGSIPMVSRGMVEDPVSNPVLDFGDRITELFHDSLTLQSLDGVISGFMALTMLTRFNLKD